MRLNARLSPLLLLAAAFSFPALAQQPSTQPTAPQAPQEAQPPAPAPTAPAPDTTQALPDSPGTQVPVSPQPTGPTAVFDTSMGRMTCKLFSKEAPDAVANFIGLATGTKDWTDPATHQPVTGKPLYNGTQFHRVIPGFMIQGGDPLATGMGDPGYMFPDEFDPNLNFDVPGRLAMANSGPNTNGSQFFITEAANDELDQKYTIFGQCDDPSIEVVKSIARVERDPQDKPLSPVYLNKVTIVGPGRPIPPAPAPAPAPVSAPGTAPPPQPQQ